MILSFQPTGRQFRKFKKRHFRPHCLGLVLLLSPSCWRFRLDLFKEGGSGGRLRKANSARSISFFWRLLLRDDTKYLPNVKLITQLNTKIKIAPGSMSKSLFMFTSLNQIRTKIADH